MSAHEFFSHPIFNIVLYNNIGKKEYDKLVLCFKMPKINKDGYIEVTKSFNEVFESVPYTSSLVFSDNIRKYNKLKLNIDSSLDINFLLDTINIIVVMQRNKIIELIIFITIFKNFILNLQIN